MRAKRVGGWSVVLTVAVALTACGGSGGGGGTGGGGGGSNLLSGDYAYVVLVRDTTLGQVRCEMGLASANGSGTFTISSTYLVSGGGAVGPLTPVAATYTETSGRSIFLTGLAGVPLAGRVAADGSLALLSSRTGPHPATAILMRRHSAPAVPNLAGVWSYLDWNRQPAPGGAQSTLSDATVSATGGLFLNAAPLVYNLDGMINPFPVAFAPQQLTVAPDGWLTTTFPPAPAPHMRGAMSADNNLVLLGGSFLGSVEASVTILVRKNQAAATSAMTGDYFEANFESSVLGFLGGWGSATLDGSGGGTWSYSFNLEGADFGPASINLVYGVLPDGTWGMTDVGPGVSWNGTVGAGGNYAFLAGGFTAGSGPLLMGLIR